MKDRKMENSFIITKKNSLEILDILKEALNFSCNIYFLIFSLLTSLPLIFTSVYYETFVLTTLAEAKQILIPPRGYYNYNWPVPDFISSKNLIYKLIQLLFLHLFPLHLLETSTAFLIVDFASKKYTGEKHTSLKETVKILFHKEKLTHIFTTSVYVFCLETCTLIGLTWLIANYYIIWSNVVYSGFFALIYGVAFVILLSKYLEWSALWNISIVISILEEKVYGAEAFALSEFLCKGNSQKGRFLMFVFFVCRLIVRLPCLCTGCYEIGNAIIIQTSCLCLANMIKWVACLVYFYDSKRQKVVRKADEELGRETK